MKKSLKRQKSNKDKNESLFKEENQESNHYKRVSEFDLKLFETKSLIKDNLCSFNEVNLKSEDCLNISVSCIVGTMPELITSLKTCPAPTEGNWSTSPTKSKEA